MIMEVECTSSLITISVVICILSVYQLRNIFPLPFGDEALFPTVSSCYHDSCKIFNWNWLFSFFFLL